MAVPIQILCSNAGVGFILRLMVKCHEQLSKAVVTWPFSSDVSVLVTKGLVPLTFLSQTGFQPIPGVGARVHATLQQPGSKH